MLSIPTLLIISSALTLSLYFLIKKGVIDYPKFYLIFSIVIGFGSILGGIIHLFLLKFYFAFQALILSVPILVLGFYGLKNKKR